MPDWVVLKFGGTSVSTRERWDTIARIVQQRLDEGVRPFVVCSAASRISRMLNQLIEDAAAGRDYELILGEIRQRHLDLGADLEVDAAALLHTYFAELERLALGISLTHEAGPPLRARILASGELMSTTLGAAYLDANGTHTKWLDARRILTATRQPTALPQRRYLSATCDADPDTDLQARLTAEDASVLLTQGFIAASPGGETVLLGWGGSDTSAAYFAAKLQAQRLEIWTDVPGMFTANPKLIPSARLLRQLDYDEAQELATAGAEVLHARCIDPVRRLGIPLHILCTDAPEMEHTVVAADVPDFGPQVKSITAQSGVTLIAMETLGMWQQVGFLADVFAIFRRHNLSIDLAATSETNVTVSLSAAVNELDEAVLDALREDLAPFCTVRILGPCVSVSLIGRHIRFVLPELGPALEAFDEQQILLVSQSASDLNCTFVVQAEETERLLRRLHAHLFNAREDDGLFGPTWRELFESDMPTTAGRGAWWRQRRDDLLNLAAQNAPVYVYDEATLRASVEKVRQIGGVDRLFYAIKANAHLDVLRIFYEMGLGFECVSAGELDRILSVFPGIDPNRVLFTPNFAPRDEYEQAFRLGVHITLDNLYPLEAWPGVFSDRDLLLRLDPGRGQGHHKHVRTAGAQSKFGVSPRTLDRLQLRLDQTGARVVGLHAHLGSGITQPDIWAETAVFLAGIAERFPDVRILNLGGGLGVAERPGALPLDLSAVSEGLAPFIDAYPQYEIWMEPGRYLVAEAGVLLARVTQLKQKEGVRFVGLETGTNSLIRPALYGAYHEIVNLTKLDAPLTQTAEVVGPICESGDVLGHGRRLPDTEEGDVMLIATAGAYGRVMSSEYNLRPPAAEALLKAHSGHS